MLNRFGISTTFLIYSRSFLTDLGFYFIHRLKLEMKYMSLETDYTTVGQIFALVIDPRLQKNDKFGIKIRGAFATRDEAANHAKRLQKEDPPSISMSSTCTSGS